MADDNLFIKRIKLKRGMELVEFAELNGIGVALFRKVKRGRRK